jgi:hypothetical protein
MEKGSASVLLQKFSASYELQEWIAQMKNTADKLGTRKRQ